jgi:uncharacterized protein involved in outer membrane biogenesis
MDEATKRPARWGRIAGIAVLALVVAIGICEALGWPFLAKPMEQWLGSALQRRVSLSADPATAPRVKIHLLGSVDLTAAFIEIGAPPWSDQPYTLRARDARMKLGYGDLWRARGGEPLRIRELRAGALDSRIERRADGRASWQFGKQTDQPDTADTPSRLPVFGHLQVDSGTLSYRDALIAAELDATYSLVEGANVSAAGVQASGQATGLQFVGKGTYQKQPVRIELKTNGVLPVIAEDAAQTALPVVLEARIGGAVLRFNGTATDALHLTALKGRFSVQGPSLAALGDPLNVTLPTTPPFRAQGLIAKDGVVWNAVFEQATIGASRLAGAFTYDPRPARPVLAGRLTGTKLLLADLGPTVGTPAKKSAAVPDVVPTAAAQRDTAAPGHVLPNREFDLPSLRAMDANVLVDIDNLDLGSSFLEPLKPLRAHLVLIDGVLTLRELEARTGQGRLFGSVGLDGRGAIAKWTADLRWSAVRLESWIRQARADDAPPWATGRLDGQARVAGEGKSTAAILGSLRGGVRMQVRDGTVSHLAVEALGIDVAQGLGMLIKGDDALPVECSVVDLVADKGLLKPRALVIDTRDSTIWADGSLSLATESMDLRVVTAPKDFSPLALRTPVHIKGTFAKPAFSLETGPLAKRVGAAALLALLNPIAAILPLIDTGNSDDAKRGTDTCRALSKRIAARPSLAAPPAPKPAARSNATAPARPR